MNIKEEGFPEVTIFSTSTSDDREVEKTVTSTGNKTDRSTQTPSRPITVRSASDVTACHSDTVIRFDAWTVLSELFCIRQLLAIFPARTYDDLFAGRPEARIYCEELGIWSPNDEERLTMEYIISPNTSAAVWITFHDQHRLLMPTATASAIRNMFLILITNSDKALAALLFETFWPYLANVIPENEFQCQHTRLAVLEILNDDLRPFRYDLSDVGLPPLPYAQDVPSSLRKENQRYDVHRLCHDARLPLSSEQASWIDDVSTTCLCDDSSVHSQVFFLGGNAGTGKSRCLSVLLARLRYDGHIALPCAFMASAASLLMGGDTLHRLFKIPVRDDDAPYTELRSRLTRESNNAILIRAAKVIIIDEISMVSKQLLQCINRACQLIRSTSADDPNMTKPFGGLCVVFAGDFKQLTPILKQIDRTSTLAHSVTDSELFKNARKHFLHHQYRVEDKAFEKFTLSVGYGIRKTIPCPNCQHHGNNEQLHCWVCHNLGFLPENQHDVIDGLMTKQLADINEVNLQYTTSPEAARSFAGRDGDVISFLNADVQEHNNAFVPSLSDEPSLRTVAAFNSVQRSADDVSTFAVTQDIMDRYSTHSLPPTHLHLWKGARISLMRNLKPSVGLYNGQRMTVVSFERNVLTVRLHTDNTVHHIPRIALKSKLMRCEIVRRQFPVKLAYSSTVNRVQGQTLHGNVVLDLRRHSFCHGQLYVALTRVKHANQLLLLVDPSFPCLTSIVYQELLHASADTPPTNSSLPLDHDSEDDDQLIFF